MSARSSIFRDALQVSPERIAALDEADLSTLMRDLLSAHAHRCNATVSEIRVNTEGLAKDDGSDGWSPTPPASDPWFGATATCWQFKAGSAGEPARLTGEVTKRIPRETLASGGRFVVVASGSTNGKKGEEARLEMVRGDAQATGLAVGGIDVLGSERLANWCNQHPAVAARWAGRPEGLWRLEDWARSDEHSVPWQPNSSTVKEIEARRLDLDFAAGAVIHMHVEGPRGVGKTRFALELCRGSPWASTTIYIRQAADVRVMELIDGATADVGVRLMVVVDEVQAEQLRPLRDSLGRGEGRVRLITVGHCKTPDPTRIPALAVAPLESQQMSKVIAGWHPSMPREHVEFVVRFADGFVRLAHLAADAIARNPSTDVRGLLDLKHVRGFLDRMLGGGDRTALYVVAALRTVGWTDDRQAEGEAVARHLGLDWNDVRASVDAFDRRYGIAPRGGRYRYISPIPLGIYLAVEAWTSFPDVMKKLPEALPSDQAREAYYDRLQEIASNPQARKFAREELAFFFRAADFVDARAAKRWSALAAADATLAASTIAKALSAATVGQRAAIAGQARRDVVSVLVRLCWKRAAFRHAAIALALLGEAENETWANNATAEFVARFQVSLGGTAVPYVERLAVLDEILALRRPVLARMAIKALAGVGNPYETRWHGEPASDEVPEPEWHPASGADVLACIERAVERLTTIARGGVAELFGELIQAARGLSMLLRKSDARLLLARFFEAIRAAYPEAREPLRRVIAEILHRERKYWMDLTEEAVAEIEALHARFEDASLGARVRQHVGPSTWESDEQRDLLPLASELTSDHAGVEREWEWLTSGEAGEAWRFGESLAIADVTGQLDDILPSLSNRGRDLRVLGGYASTRWREKGDAWFDNWQAQTLAARPHDLAPLFELTWRCGATVGTARLIASVLRENEVDPDLANLLGNGSWGQTLPREVLEDFLHALVDRRHLEAAASILDHRMTAIPLEAEAWESLALELVTNSTLIRSAHMANYYWQQLANRILERHASGIAVAIIREQADRMAEIWFADHSAAKIVLHKCVETDAAGVWLAVAPHLSSMRDAASFSVGFPEGLLDRMPSKLVGAWIAEKPTERASAIARVVNKKMATDDALAARVLGNFGDNEDVASAFFAAYVTGSWTGPASDHWRLLGRELEAVAQRTALPRLRNWALNAAENLRRMAERDAEREAERDLRRE